MKKQEPWISANEAADIISKNSGRPVHSDYVRLLARQNPKKLASKPLDGRTNVYLRTDVEKIKVKAKRKSSESTEKPSILEESTSATTHLARGTEGQSEESSADNQPAA